MRDCRFSTNVFSVESRQRFVSTCRRAEELGYDAEMAEQLRAHRERYGYSHVTVHGSYMDTFAPVMSALRRA